LTEIIKWDRIAWRPVICLTESWILGKFSFRDHYMDLPFDLSKVMFITTANVIQTIHPALKDRMEVLVLAGYTEEEKLGIALNYLVPRQLKENGLTRDNIEFEKESLLKIISGYTRSRGQES
jgi:ATP-dependent Lon protease